MQAPALAETEALQTLVRDFAHCIRNGGTPLTDSWSGVRVLGPPRGRGPEPGRERCPRSGLVRHMTRWKRSPSSICHSSTPRSPTRSRPGSPRWSRPGQFVQGPGVEAFEREFAHFNGVAHCAGVGNGTDAVDSLCGPSVSTPGDRVIVPANSFIATAEAVLRNRARPVLVDCRADDLLIDVGAAVQAAKENSAAAVVPVDLFGQCANSVSIVAGLGSTCPVVVDAAQSQGATHNGLSSAQIGAVAATSFYPGKNLGAYGDAGAVRDDEDIVRRVRLMANHGSPRRYVHEIIGWNSRLDTLPWFCGPSCSA